MARTTTKTKTTTPKTTSKTTRTRSTTSKSRSSTARAATAPKPAEIAEAAVVQEDLPIVSQPAMRKRELIDLVVQRSGAKKRNVKPAIDAALAVLGEALAEGRELNLAPMGKLKVTRMKQAGNGQIINARLRQPMPAKQDDAESSETPLAPSDD